MKILSGEFKGLHFYTPKDVAVTQSVVRKAVFDLLGQDLSGLTFVDLFAGSGSMGLEALSRGADYVVFIEKEFTFTKIIRENIALMPLQPRIKGGPGYEIIKGDAYFTIKELSRQEKRFDILFIDPPYVRQMARKALKTLEAYDILQPNCTIMVQHEKHEILPESQGRFLLYRQCKYGGTHLTIYKAES